MNFSMKLAGKFKIKFSDDVPIVRLDNYTLETLPHNSFSCNLTNYVSGSLRLLLYDIEKIFLPVSPPVVFCSMRCKLFFFFANLLCSNRLETAEPQPSKNAINEGCERS